MLSASNNEVILTEVRLKATFSEREDKPHTVAEGSSIALTKEHDSVVQGLTVSVRPSLKQTQNISVTRLIP